MICRRESKGGSATLEDGVDAKGDDPEASREDDRESVEYNLFLHDSSFREMMNRKTKTIIPC